MTTSSAPLVDGDSQKVVYSPTEVIAYFDAMGNNVEPEHAAYAKVWTSDGALAIVSLTEGEVAPVE